MYTKWVDKSIPIEYHRKKKKGIESFVFKNGTKNLIEFPVLKKAVYLRYRIGLYLIQ